MGKLSTTIVEKFNEIAAAYENVKKIKLEILQSEKLSKADYAKLYALYSATRYYHKKNPKKVKKQDPDEIIECKVCGSKVKAKNFQIHELSRKHKKALKE